MPHTKSLFDKLGRCFVALVPAIALIAACLVHPQTDSAQTIITRGPYLQMGTSSGVTLRWRTGTATDSRVRYGNDPANLNQVVDVTMPTTEHSVRLTNLSSKTKYFYSVGTAAETLAGGDANHFFMTAPSVGELKPTRIWALGDFGWAGVGLPEGQTAVRDAYYNFTGARYTDVWLMLGDNAYNNGTDAEYKIAVFDIYQSLLRQTVVWPTIGNHDSAGEASPLTALPYHDIFDLPMNAEAGGMASGTEDYYSFNYGNIHFVCLDSMTTSRAPGSPMLVWLQNDLAANNRDWLIAYWHHPPYSKGSHDSDVDIELMEMRQNVLPILEAWGVDLVLSGHSHSYERSYLIDGHYGLSSTFTDSMKKNAGDGRVGGNGAYQKATLGAAPHEGAVYAVAGSGGFIGGGELNHPAMFVSLNQLGSLVIDINGNRLEARFLRENGVIDDSFMMLKGFVANELPSVNLSSPVNGATFNAQAAITLAASASDKDGSIAKVEFFQNNQLIGAATASPYQFIWRDVAAGNYSLTAKATDNRGATVISSAINIAVGAVAPAAPGDLKATMISRASIDLAWTDNSGNEDGFKIERSSDGRNFVELAAVGVGVTAFSDIKLQRDSRYFYRVQAFNATGNSPYSNIASPNGASRPASISR